MEFKSFNKIEHLDKLQMRVTQKIHGTNAQVVIYQYESTNDIWHEPRIGIKIGSRNRWITPNDDNYGFATFVEENKETLINLLGLGQHFGEWAGPGINSGEGLRERCWILFDPWRYKTIPEDYPPRVKPVPILHEGEISPTTITNIMDDLIMNGSKLVPGYMKPEGIVVSINGQRYKKVFESEESPWKQTVKSPKPGKDETDYTYLCQPIRLEKLLSKDERYIRDYPNTLRDIVKDYFADLLEENQIIGTSEEIKIISKGASNYIFKFIREFMKGR